MNLTCPCCGGVASLEAMTNDSEARAVMAAISKLPQPVAAITPGYLGLFRPDKRALSWRKAHSLLTSLSALIGVGYVQVKGRADRDCPPRIWAQAMDDMVNRRDRLTRPLPNHNYLRQVAHDMAGMEDAANERARVGAAEARIAGSPRPMVTPPLHPHGDYGPTRIASINPLAHLMED